MSHPPPLATRLEIRRHLHKAIDELIAASMVDGCPLFVKTVCEFAQALILQAFTQKSIGGRKR